MQQGTEKVGNSVLVFALPIFLSSFLLFQIQPAIAKYILPWFGGSSGVWITVVLFFQAFLVLGYAYAHALVRFKLSTQAIIHGTLLLVAVLVFLPVIPDAGWKPLAGTNPVAYILLLLTATIGLPYFILSSTGPLLQAWFSAAAPGTSPYPLYALSNAASLVALISFPVIVEPLLSTRVQLIVWSLGFGLYTVLVAAAAVSSWKKRALASEQETRADAGPRPPAAVYAFWFALPACAAVLLLAVTNYLTQDIAAVPFLWIIPLALYLFSFVLAFQNARWYSRIGFLSAFLLMTLAASVILFSQYRLGLGYQIAVFSALLFSGCMVCHGELARLAPAPARLTSFYLLIALGGAFGGLLVAVVAPIVFKVFLELHFGLMATVLLALFVVAYDQSWIRSVTNRVYWVIWLLVLLVSGWYFVADMRNYHLPSVVAVSRNFYSSIRVIRGPGVLTLVDRGVRHGEQFTDLSLRHIPTAYFAAQSGLGLTFAAFDERENLRVGVIGLGAGTVAAYGRSGDQIRFYELNPEVEVFARRYFTFLADSPAQVDVVLGDGRLSMEREPEGAFDVIVVDAFSGDAIPVHLLTKEAFALYQARLAPGGAILFHVSSQYLDLRPLVEQLARSAGFTPVFVRATVSTPAVTYSSDWIIATANQSILTDPNILAAAAGSPSGDGRPIRLWTDDYSNLLRVVR